MKDDYYCPDCGEVNDDCVCELYEDSQEVDESEWQFEYAFESITESNSSFRRIKPLK